jgi:hypothetical protein
VLNVGREAGFITPEYKRLCCASNYDVKFSEPWHQILSFEKEDSIAE